jgi:hypothetical protein
MAPWILCPIKFLRLLPDLYPLFFDPEELDWAEKPRLRRD